MVRFLRELRRIYGRMVIFTDNAGIHKARDVLDFVRECREGRRDQALSKLHAAAEQGGEPVAEHQEVHRQQAVRVAG